MTQLRGTFVNDVSQSNHYSLGVALPFQSRLHFSHWPTFRSATTTNLSVVHTSQPLCCSHKYKESWSKVAICNSLQDNICYSSVKYKSISLNCSTKNICFFLAHSRILEAVNLCLSFSSIHHHCSKKGSSGVQIYANLVILATAATYY